MTGPAGPLPGTFIPPSIVVGVDGSRSSEHAALWALDEAIGRELPLRLVAAAQPDGDAKAAGAAVHAVESAVRATGSAVSVTAEVVSGQPAEALLRAARTATMICVGAVGPKHFEHRVGSTAGALVASAHCPVAVVRGEKRDGWIVVETDETSGNAAVLQAGVEEARMRNAPLRVLGTWQSEHPDAPDADERSRLVRAHLDRNLETWRHRYPDLDVEPVAVHGSGLPWLSANADAIALMVVGARNIVAVSELLGPAGSAALPHTSLLIVDPQRLL